MPEGTYYKPAQVRPTKYGCTGPRPQVWVSGPDVLRHEQHIAYMRHKAQATWRGEAYELTLNQWYDLWQPDLWARRGRSSHCVILTRHDETLPWSMTNCKFMTRKDHLVIHAKKNIGKRYRTKARLANNE